MSSHLHHKQRGVAKQTQTDHCKESEDKHDSQCLREGETKNERGTVGREYADEILGKGDEGPETCIARQDKKNKEGLFGGAITRIPEGLSRLREKAEETSQGDKERP